MSRSDTHTHTHTLTELKPDLLFSLSLLCRRIKETAREAQLAEQRERAARDRIKSASIPSSASISSLRLRSSKLLNNTTTTSSSSSSMDTASSITSSGHQSQSHFSTTSSMYGNFSGTSGVGVRTRLSSSPTTTTTTTTAGLGGSRADRRRSSDSTSRLGTELAASTSACVGLQNLGNTCFMNSILQCLFGVRELIEFFDEASKSQFKDKARLAKAFQELVQKILRSSHSAIVSPNGFHEKVRLKDRKWGGMRQHDSQEFLQFLLNALREQCNRNADKKPKYRELDGKGSQAEQAEQALTYYKSWHDSIIDDIFGGLLESSITCSHCSHISYCFDPFLDLSVPVPGSDQLSVNLHDCLSKFTEKEKLEDIEGYKCEKCKNQTGACKKLSIYKPPNVLILHLKRFSGGGLSRFSRFSKNSARVSFDTELDISKYCSAPSVSEAVQRNGFKYRLFAISHHSGSLSGGHYFAEVENAFDKSWYNLNDSIVSSCRQPASSSSTAYVLFYRRV